jgi:hypothetical protein
MVIYEYVCTALGIGGNRKMLKEFETLNSLGVKLLSFHQVFL